MDGLWVVTLVLGDIIMNYDCVGLTSVMWHVRLNQTEYWLKWCFELLLKCYECERLIIIIIIVIKVNLIPKLLHQHIFGVVQTWFFKEVQEYTTVTCQLSTRYTTILNASPVPFIESTYLIPMAITYSKTTIIILICNKFCLKPPHHLIALPPPSL